MLLRFNNLINHSKIFLAMTGLRTTEFITLLKEVRPLLLAARHTRLERPARKRKVGAGHPFALRSHPPTKFY